MLTFKRFFNDKLDDREFKTLYEQECHVCAYTMQIFEAIERRQLTLNRVAADLTVSVDALLKLKSADVCDPHLVVQLCRHLDLAPPPDCPRR